MHIVEPGNVTCECCNDELVFVQCLPPYQGFFRIVCRKCSAEGHIEAKPESLRTYTTKKKGG